MLSGTQAFGPFVVFISLKNIWRDMVLESVEALEICHKSALYHQRNNRNMVVEAQICQKSTLYIITRLTKIWLLRPKFVRKVYFIISDMIETYLRSK